MCLALVGELCVLVRRDKSLLGCTAFLAVVTRRRLSLRSSPPLPAPLVCSLGPLFLFSDCAAVVNEFSKSRDDSLSPNRPYSGLVMQSYAFSGKLIRSVQKVKAHQADDPDLSAAERRHIIGNNAADEAAKAGARLHADMEEADRSN